MEGNMERDCSVLGGLFQTIINDMKGSVPVWEDFTNKACKLHAQLKSTIVAVSVFLEAFQRIADIATNSRGATKDMGASLTRMCIRHKTIELKLKSFTNAIMECLVAPLQERMEEWKKITTQLDKEHAKEYKKARQEIKKKSSDTVRLQKKARKGKADIQYRLDSAMQDVSDMYLLLEETEKNAVRGGMVEERSRFCTLISCFKPVVDEEISMLSEVNRLESVLNELVEHGKDPYILPQASEQVIMDVKGQDIKWTYQTPPGSPSPSSGSRKSSMCSLSSMTSSDSRSSSSTNSHSPGANFVRHRSLSQPNSAYRLSSVSSQDSGFTSQDMLFPNQPGTPPQTVPEESVQTRLLHSPSAPYELEQRSSSECSTPSSPTPPPSSSSHFSLTPSQASQGFAPPPPSWLVNYSQPERMQRPKSIPAPLTTSAVRVPPPMVADKPMISPKPGKGGDSKPPPFVPDFNTPQLNQIVPRPMFTAGQQVTSEQFRQRSATLPARRHTHCSMPSAVYPDGDNSSHGSLSNSSGYSTQSTAGTYSDDTPQLQDDRCHSLDGSTDCNFTDNSKPADGYSNVTESMYATASPNQSPTRRPLSMSCIPAPSAGDPLIRNASATTPGGSLRKSKPPPPIRRTPSGGSLTGMNISPEATTPQPSSDAAFGHTDPSGVFRRPLTPGRLRSQSTVQPPCSAPDAQQSTGGAVTPQGRVHRSHSLKLTGDGMAGDLARLNLMESLNAKLAQRQPAAAPMVPSSQDPAVRSQNQMDQHYYAQQMQHMFAHQQQQYQRSPYQQQYPDSQQQYNQGMCNPPPTQQQKQQQQRQQLNQGMCNPPPIRQQQQQPQVYQGKAYVPTPSQANPPQANLHQRQQQVQQQLQQQLNHGMVPVHPNQQGHGPPQLREGYQQQQDDGGSSSSSSDEGLGILADIKRGVKLRRTVSNDRSAPKI